MSGGASGGANPEVFDGAVPAAPVVFLCGSTRYPTPYEREERRLTLAGHLVLRVGPLSPGGAAEDGPRSETVSKAQGRTLLQLHLLKVDLADEVRVVNPSGDLDEAARRGILRAVAAGKPLSFTDDPRPTLVRCIGTGCDARDVFGCGGVAAVGAALRAGWRSVPSVGWLCPSCAETDPGSRPGRKGDR